MSPAGGLVAVGRAAGLAGSWQLGQLTEEWLAVLDVAPETRRNYADHLRAYDAWLTDTDRRGDRPDHLRDWREVLLGRVRGAGDLGLATAREMLTTVCRFYTYLFQRGIAPADFGATVRRIRAPRNLHAKDYLTVAQARHLLAVVGGDAAPRPVVRLRDLAYLLLKLKAGVRDIEVVRANVGHLRVLGDGQAELAVHGKGRDAADQTVLVTPEALDALRAYLTARGVWDQPSVPLFVSHSDRSRDHRLTSRGLREIVRHRLDQAGLKSARVTGHSLRHTAATLALSHGASLERVQEMLRHASPTTTAIYAKRLDRVTGAAELAIPALLGVG